MKNSNKILISTSISIVFLVELSLTVSAQNSSSSFPISFDRQNNQTQLLAQKQPDRQTKKKSTWESILGLFRRNRQGRNLGSRGVCVVTPGIIEDNNIIWHNRPLFIWQAVGLPQEIRLYSPFDPQQEQQIIWRENPIQQSSSLTFQGTQYMGQPLEAGKIYDWEIFNQSSKSQERRSFQVMDDRERDRIARELQQLEADLKSEKATDEEIIIERSNYFIEQNLWSDALQEMFSLKNSSPQSIQTIQTILNDLCGTNNANLN